MVIRLLMARSQIFTNPLEIVFVLIMYLTITSLMFLYTEKLGCKFKERLPKLKVLFHAGLYTLYGSLALWDCTRVPRLASYEIFLSPLFISLRTTI